MDWVIPLLGVLQVFAPSAGGIETTTATLETTATVGEEGPPILRVVFPPPPGPGGPDLVGPIPLEAGRPPSMILAPRVPPPPVAGEDLASETRPVTTSTPAGAEPLDPLRLAALVNDAVLRNLDLAARRIQARSSRQDVARARSTFDPTVSFGLSDDTDRTSFLDRLTGARRKIDAGLGTLEARVRGLFPTGTRYDLAHMRRSSSRDPKPGFLQRSDGGVWTLDVVQPLLRGRGRSVVHAGVDRARLAADATREDLDRLLEIVIAEVEQVFWDLRRAEAAVVIAMDSREAARVLLERNLELFERDLGTQVEVITARRGLAQRTANLILAWQRHRDSFETLVYLVHGAAAARELDRSTAIPPTGGVDLATDPLPPLDEDLAVALDQRHDAHAARANLEASRIALRVARNATLPDLSFVGSLTIEDAFDTGQQDLVAAAGADVDRKRWVAGLVFSLPFENLSARADLARARLDLEQRGVALEVVENRTRQEVRFAHRAVASTFDRQVQSQRAARYAYEHLLAETKLLDLGLSDSFRLLQVEQEEVNARSLELQARTDHLVAWTDYRLATGRIVEEYFTDTGEVRDRWRRALSIGAGAVVDGSSAAGLQ